MYARVLRKWSLTKVLMYLWLLPVLMLLVIYCQNATTMHLNGIINTKLSSSILSSSLSTSPGSVSKIIIKKPATLLSSTIQEDDNINKKILTPIDNIIINDDQYYYDNDNDYQQEIIEEQQQKNKFIKPLNNKNGLKPIISNYNDDDDDNYHQINQKTNKPLLIAENSAPILITVQTVSNADSVSISDTNNASAKVPNLNSQIINLNNYNNINNNHNNNNNSNNNNNKYNSLTSSANIDTISSNNNNNNNNLNNRSNKFRRHIQRSRILSVNDNIQPQESTSVISSTFQQENLLNAQAQQQQSPPYLSHQLHQNTNSQNLHSDRSKLINNNDQISSFNKNHQNLQNNDNHELPQIFDQLSSQQERFYELRERRTRIEAHRRRLMRLNQLRSTQSSTSSTQIMMNNKNSEIQYNQLLIPTEATTSNNRGQSSLSDVQKDIDSNGSVVELNKLLAGRNRRDSRPHPLHLSSVPSSIQPLYSHQSGLGSSSMTMLTVPSVQPSYSSYPAVQSTGYYRQSPPLYQHYNTNNNYNNMNNYNHLNQQQHHNHQQYNNNNNNQQQQHHQQQRKRPRRYCSARDPAQLAFEAPTVFEGKIISMSYDRRANFSVTFEVKEIFKKQIGYMLPNLLRLQFTYRNTSGECDIYREYLRPRGLVRGNELEQGRVYILFVQQIDLGNFTILGQPVRKTRRAVNSVRKGVSENYAQAAFIRSLTAIANDKRIDNDKRIKNGEELRIICRVSGQPPPKVTWFKDDKSINRNRKLYQFVHLKKRSELIIRSFNSTDAGVYECRAKNKNSRKPERKIIRIESFPRITYESSSQQSGDECTHDMQIYCLNGGTCKYFKEIHDFSCECPDGFYGDRCQEKQWNETPSTYSKEQECGDKKYLGSFYC